MENEEMEIDLHKLWDIIRQLFVYFVIIVLVCTLAAFLGTKLLVQKTYTATAKIIIVQKTDSTVNSSITYSDVQLSQKLVSTYTQILTSEAISDVVVKNLRLEYYGITSENYNSVVSVSAASNTEVMNITATTQNPKLSADIANEIVAVFQDKIYSIMQIENVSILNNAKVPTKPSGPRVMRNTALGMLVGMVICGAIAMFRLLTDTKVKTEEEAKEILDYPVIGVIPEFNVSNEAKGDNE